jgi:hypothetical protein
MLGDRLALPLRHDAEHLDNHSTCRARRIKGFAGRHQRHVVLDAQLDKIAAIPNAAGRRSNLEMTTRAISPLRTRSSSALIPGRCKVLVEVPASRTTSDAGHAIAAQ